MANIPTKSIKFPGLSDTYTFPQIDTSLTTEGKAADAKATGQAISDEAEARENADNALGEDISDLKSALNECAGIDLYSPTWIDNKYIYRDGSINNNSSFKITEPIPVSMGDIVKLYAQGLGTDTAMISTCNSDGTGISVKVLSTSSEWTNYKYDVVADGYVCICILKSTLAKPRLAILSELSNERIKQQVDTAQNEFDKVAELIEPTNLFNKNSSLNKTDKIISSNWLLETLNGSSVTHPIPCKNGDTFCFKWYGSYYGPTSNARVMKCNNDGTSLEKGIIATGANQNAYGYFTVTWNGYFCVNVRSSEIGSMIVAKGSDLPTYSDYFEPCWKILESALPSEIPLPINAEYNPLYGKKAAFTGDSICYGAGYVGGYAGILGANNAMIVSNSGQTGATLASGTTADGTNRGWICRKVQNMPNDYDYYIVEGGVNDFALSVPLGTMTSGYYDTLDDTTVIGALESICKTLQTVFIGKKYGFIFTHKCYENTSNYITTWVPAMKLVLEKWGIPYIDLGMEAAQLRNIDALRIYTSNSDGWHPTEDGYKIYYVPKIEAWMKTL